jgi:hypothetical protein
MTPGFKAIPNEPDGVGIRRVEYTLPYILVKKDRMKYEIIDNAHPTAEVYDKMLSGGKAGKPGFRARTLFFGRSILHSSYDTTPTCFIPQ